MAHHHEEADSEAKVQQLWQRIEPSLVPEERSFVDIPCLKRYLRARNGNIEKSLHMLQETLKWRKEFKPQSIRAHHTSKEAETGKMYRRGYTTRGHPIIYMTPGRQNSNDHDSQIRHLVYLMEKTVASMRPEQEQLVLVIDYDGFSLSNAPPMKTSKETLKILSDHYPERLGYALLIDSPWLFSNMFKLLSPFIDEKTKTKIQFLPNPRKHKSLLHELIPMEQLEARFGGNDPYTYNHSERWGFEASTDPSDQAAAQQ